MHTSQRPVWVEGACFFINKLKFSKSAFSLTKHRIKKNEEEKEERPNSLLYWTIINQIFNALLKKSNGQ